MLVDSSTAWNGESVLLLGEVIGIEAFDLVRGDGCDAEVEVHHELGELGSVDQDDFAVDPAGVLARVGGEAGSGDENALARTLALKSADELLDLGSSYRRLPALGLDEDDVEAEAVLLDDSVVPALSNGAAGIVQRASIAHPNQEIDDHHENATRCFELAMDESSEQTARIHERQRLMKTEKGLHLREKAEAISRKHWNAQRLLEPLPVVIAFADRLTFPSHWMRTRRDHARFLNLIEVSAFLHQFQRERQNGAIAASIDDYTVAYELAGEVLADTFSDLRKPLREADERIRELFREEQGSVSRRDLRERLSVPDSTVRRWLSELVELEYLEVVEMGRRGAGKATRYRLSERGPKEELMLGLVSPEELRRNRQIARKPPQPVAIFKS